MDEDYEDIRDALADRGITGDGAGVIITTAQENENIDRLRDELDLGDPDV